MNEELCYSPNMLAFLQRMLPKQDFWEGLGVAVLWLGTFASVYFTLSNILPYELDRDSGEYVSNGLAVLFGGIVAMVVTNLSIKGYRYGKYYLDSVIEFVIKDDEFHEMLKRRTEKNDHEARRLLSTIKKYPRNRAH